MHCKIYFSGDFTNSGVIDITSCARQMRSTIHSDTKMAQNRQCVEWIRLFKTIKSCFSSYDVREVKLAKQVNSDGKN